MTYLEKYANNEISLSQLKSEMNKINNDSKVQNEHTKVNSEILKLLVETPDFKKHIESLNFDPRYYVKDWNSTN